MILGLIDFLPQFGILDIVDIILVAVLFYEGYRLIKGTAALNIFLGILAVFLLSKIVRILHLQMFASILDQFISVGFIALIVVFQPEIRRFLLILGTPSAYRGSKKGLLFWKRIITSPLLIDPIVQACQRMSKEQTGALIVIARQHELDTFSLTGEYLDAAISTQLLESIFAKNGPLHDGAVIIHGDRIRSARCILPVSGNSDISPNLGLRHRSAMGITEQSDAIAIVVSEQTGNISYCQTGHLTLDVSPAQLKDFLEDTFKRLDKKETKEAEKSDKK